MAPSGDSPNPSTLSKLLFDHHLDAYLFYGTWRATDIHSTCFSIQLNATRAITCYDVLEHFFPVDIEQVSF